MNRMVFGLKRGFQRSLRWVRRTFQRFGITPARFDMLMAIWPRAGVWQSEVRTILGVNRATTSQMMRALVKLGLVRRTRDPDDKRQLRVAIALERARDVKRYADAAYASGESKDLIAYALDDECHDPDDPGSPKDDCTCLRYEIHLYRLLHRLRENLDDPASLDYALPGAS